MMEDCFFLTAGHLLLFTKIKTKRAYHLRNSKINRVMELEDMRALFEKSGVRILREKVIFVKPGVFSFAECNMT